MTMTSAELRRRFLEFFEARDHTVVTSSPLVPDDPTLLFVNAGMVQFKDTFLGLEDRPYARATSSQKCLRVTGKHNDLETVGPSPRHHTFFEMLGNFSFGDYFKREAIQFAWQFFTEEMQIEPARLIHTVHRDDDEAFSIWVEEIGVPEERVLRMGDKTNFWMMADVGPCGPTSEIHYDFGVEHCTCGEPECSVALDNDCGRWLEVWNLVFMQYDQSAAGELRPLPKTGVDTGMGLERLSAVVQGVYSNYETDLFVPILDAIQTQLGQSNAEREEHAVGYRVLADHGRSMTFLIADGVLPGNDGRNYVLRLIMRRAMRFGRQIGFSAAFLPELVESVIETMGDAYPEIRSKSEWIKEVVREEETRFARTLESGLELLDKLIADLLARGEGEIPGVEIFRLYDTFGFPPDLTRVVAEEHGLSIDRQGFDEAMAGQRERARAGGTFGVEEGDDLFRRLELPPTEFIGYTDLTGTSEVIALVRDGKVVDQASSGDSVGIVLTETPFYAESGGQVGDTGVLVAENGRFTVTDTDAPVPGVVVHHGKLDAGSIEVGEAVRAEVDADRRLDIMRNHTATHLLHAALQSVLGDHAQQRGSLVAPDRLRFDFAHLKAMTPDEIAEVERRVNAMVRSDFPVQWSRMALDEARQLGAMMLFGEKYGDIVRVVEVDGQSRELCGGTHLRATGEIGSFIITQETSVGSGIRRIEARTGRGADAYVRDRLGLLNEVAGQLGVPSPERVLDRLRDVEERLKELEQEVTRARSRLAASSADDLLSAVVHVNGVAIVAARVDAASADGLRQRIDVVKAKLGSGVIVLGSVIEGRPRIAAAVTDDLVAKGLHAGHIVREVATRVGGGGGGRPQLAEAGGRQPEALGAALEAVPDIVAELRANDGD